MNLQSAIDAEIDGSARAVFLALAFMCGGDDTCTAAVAEIMTATGLSRRCVFAQIAKLEASGNLQVERRAGRGNPSNFRPIVNHGPVKRVHGGKTMQAEKPNDFGQRVHDKTQNSLYRVVDDDACTLSDEIRGRRCLDKRTQVIRRRQAVRDGYLSFIAMLDAGQYVTVPALAKELGMSPNVVRGDLNALFTSLDICVEDQMRLRKAERRPWHFRKITRQPITNHAERR